MYLRLPSMFHLFLSALCHGSEYFEDTYMERPEIRRAASLGAENLNFGNNHSTFEAAANRGSFNKLLFGRYVPDVTYLVIGFRNGNYGAFIGITYDNTSDVKKLCQLYNGTFTWY